MLEREVDTTIIKGLVAGSVFLGVIGRVCQAAKKGVVDVFSLFLPYLSSGSVLGAHNLLGYGLGAR